MFIGIVRIWNVVAGQERASFRADSSGKVGFWCPPRLEFDKDDKVLATGVRLDRRRSGARAKIPGRQQIGGWLWMRNQITLGANGRGWMRGLEFLLAIYAFCFFVAGFGVYVVIVGRIQAGSRKEWVGIKARLSGFLC
ncbi:MAG TPA: hypothetical protein VG013_14625, partial [Gemmataceae bacterium]|nr:hypothetical protein [Gemmataceae bacterium]